MKDIGYGAGYSYDHDAPEGFSGDNYWPDAMEAATFYRPVDRGFEKRIAERLVWWDRSEEHTSELQSLMRISYAVFCLKQTSKRIPRTASRPSAPTSPWLSKELTRR